MKHIALLILIMIVDATNLVSQSWNSETVWVYETDEFGPPIYGNFLVQRILSDTLIDNEQFFKVQAYMRNHVTGDLTPVNGSLILLQYESNRIYLYDQSDSTKHMIYDFGLEAGESYLAYCDIEKEYFKVNIDSVGQFVQNGIQRKIQYVSSENISGCYLHGKIIEGMGFEEYILPRYTFVDPPPGGYIVCFNDEFISYPNDEDCQDIISSSKNILSKELKFYPNPTCDIIYFEGEFDPPFKIYSTLGKLVVEGSIDNNAISTEKLSQGMYFLRIKQGNNDLTYTFLRL